MAQAQALQQAITITITIIIIIKATLELGASGATTTGHRCSAGSPSSGCSRC
jgi:hypothetical protein